MRLESGPGGGDVVEAGPGDFLRVPAGAVHRESNPGDAPSRAVIVRCGTGEPTVNVDGPAPDPT
ncbi:cupin domain-containing protein [Nocardioides coralli]|nr:cupin domain-containing protein [Nocardioides coralli]